MRSWLKTVQDLRTHHFILVPEQRLGTIPSPQAIMPGDFWAATIAYTFGDFWVAELG